MEYIKSYFLNIIAVILFTVVVEILTPNSSFKGYIKLVLGLLVIFTVINPITNLLNIDFSSFYETNDAKMTSSQIEEVQNDQINKVFCEKLEKAITTNIENEFNESVSVDVVADTDEIHKITVLGISTENENAVVSYISNTYGANNVSTGR